MVDCNSGNSTHTAIGFIRGGCQSQNTEIYSYGTVNSQRAWVCVRWRALEPASKTFPRGRQHTTWISIITNSRANVRIPTGTREPIHPFIIHTLKYKKRKTLPKIEDLWSSTIIYFCHTHSIALVSQPKFISDLSFKLTMWLLSDKGNTVIYALLCFWFNLFPESCRALMSSSWANQLTLRPEPGLNVFHLSGRTCSPHHPSEEEKELKEVAPGSLEPLWGPWMGIAFAVLLWVPRKCSASTWKLWQKQPAEKMIKRHLAMTFKHLGERGGQHGCMYVRVKRMCFDCVSGLLGWNQVTCH